MSATVISLGERLARTVPPGAMNPLPPADCLSEKVSTLGCYMEMASLRARKAGDVDGAALLWRMALSAHEAAKSAERLERKNRKLKRKAKGK